MRTWEYREARRYCLAYENAVHSLALAIEAGHAGYISECKADVIRHRKRAITSRLRMK